MVDRNSISLFDLTSHGFRVMDCVLGRCMRVV